MEVGKAGLDAIYQASRHVSSFQGLVRRRGEPPGPLPSWRRKGQEARGRSRKLGGGQGGPQGKAEAGARGAGH